MRTDRRSSEVYLREARVESAGGLSDCCRASLPSVVTQRKSEVRHGRKARNHVGTTGRRRLVRRPFLIEDRQIYRTDSPAVTGRDVVHVPRGALGHLRQGIRLMRAGERRIVREGPMAMGAAPSREKGGDFTNVRANQHEKPTGANTVKSKRGLATDCIQAAVAANGHRAGDVALPYTFGMAVDQWDQLLAIQ